MSSSNGKNHGAKKGSGRKKVRLEKIENKSNRQVTFSKRCVGLLRKANELNALCGAEVTIIVSSPSNNFYSYGSPNVDEVVTRFVGPPTCPTKNFIVARCRETQDQVSKLVQIMDQLRLEKKRAEELKNKPRLNINNMSLEELQKLRDFVVNFRREYDNYIQNNKNLKDKQIPSPKFNLGEENILQYPKVEGHGPSVIKNMTGTAYGEVLTNDNLPSLASCPTLDFLGPKCPI